MKNFCLEVYCCSFWRELSYHSESAGGANNIKHLVSEQQNGIFITSLGVIIKFKHTKKFHWKIALRFGSLLSKNIFEKEIGRKIEFCGETAVCFHFNTLLQRILFNFCYFASVDFNYLMLQYKKTKRNFLFILVRSLWWGWEEKIILIFGLIRLEWHYECDENDENVSLLFSALIYIFNCPLFFLQK